MHLFKNVTIFENDYVVHPKHGVGIFKGINLISIENFQSEFVRIEYKDQNSESNAAVLIPVIHFGILKFHSSKDSKTEIDILGKSKVSQKRAKLQEDLMQMAQDLIKIAAEREQKTCKAFSIPESYSDFCGNFEHTLTKCQEKAIDEIQKDLANSKPMDRLLCGDVGFGKTEVALRASYIVAENKSKVLIIIPTTILASQHYELFSKRLEEFGIKCALLSRLVIKKEKDQIKDSWVNGEIDVLIATASHKGIKNLLNEQIGLVILDEEHHFGAVFKEEIRKTGHFLQLSATPIPRTLNLALSKLKDISTLENPPENRNKVKIKVAREEEINIKSLIKEELEKGGKIFLVAPKIENLGAIEKKIQGFDSVVVHGQLPVNLFEERMSNFKNGKANILIGTNIIESGLDIKSANLMMIFQAHMFGLAQLHQLKGRIGRRASQHATAYLVVPSKMKEEAENRLQTIEMHDFLGSGFSLALHDMDLRGSGTVLGKKQSGKDYGLGLETYYDMLAQAIEPEKQNEIEEIDFEGINNAFLSKNYITEEAERAMFYRRLSLAKNQAELEREKKELITKFGPLEEEAKNFLNVINLKFLSYGIGIKKFIKKNHKLEILFEDLNQELIAAASVFQPFFKPKSIEFKIDGCFFEKSKEILEKLRVVL